MQMYRKDLNAIARLSPEQVASRSKARQNTREAGSISTTTSPASYVDVASGEPLFVISLADRTNGSFRAIWTAGLTVCNWPYSV